MITRVELKERWLRLDWMVLLPAFLLLIISILFIYSAAYQREELNLQSLYRQQMLWVGVGAVVMLAAALVRGSFLEALCWPLYAGGLVLLAMVFVFGEEISGARRWLKLGILIQPSEFAKITTIVALAVFLSRRSARRGATILGAAAVTGIPFLMIASQPDLGSAAVLLPVVMSMLFVAGLPLRVLGLLLILGIVSMPLGWHLLRPYQKERILVHLDPSRDPYGSGYNKMQSEIAIGSGGLTGKGYLKGTQNALGYLPRKVAPTDFIFSVIAEETGFVGCCGLLALFSWVLAGFLRAVYAARDRFGRLLVTGLMAMFFTHVFVNIGMTAGILPIKGLPLPLVSYGGSFMIATMAAIGLVQGVYSQRTQR